MEALLSAALTPEARHRAAITWNTASIQSREKKVWQLTYRLLKLPPENDNHHFCAYVTCQSKSHGNVQLW